MPGALPPALPVLLSVLLLRQGGHTGASSSAPSFKAILSRGGRGHMLPPPVAPYVSPMFLLTLSLMSTLLHVLLFLLIHFVFIHCFWLFIDGLAYVLKSAVETRHQRVKTTFLLNEKFQKKNAMFHILTQDLIVPRLVRKLHLYIVIYREPISRKLVY